MWGQFQKRQDLVDLATIFLQPDATQENIAEAGEKCLVALYGGVASTQTLHDLRFTLFVKTAANAKTNLARLPPTTEASAFHAFRTYHQVQKWLGVEKDPTEWGWEISTRGLIPITTNKEPAPAQLLKMIACKCKKGCRGACSCLKAGLKCSALCLNCGGKSCNNIASIGDDSEEDEKEVLPQNNEEEHEQEEDHERVLFDLPHHHKEQESQPRKKRRLTMNNS